TWFTPSPPAVPLLCPLSLPSSTSHLFLSSFSLTLLPSPSSCHPPSHLTLSRYYYYTLATLGIRSWWKQYLTMLQITQFVIDIVVCYTASYAHPYLTFHLLCLGCTHVFL